MSDSRIRVRKTLVIGLGGTGRDAVLNVKRRYLEAYGPTELPTIEFLVFDTADQKPLSTDVGPVALSPGEFVKMTVANPQLVMDVNEEVRRWFPREKVRMRSITRGAGQVRAVGRLALFHNAVEVSRRIKSALDRLNGIRPHQDLGHFVLAGDSVLVNVVGSLSGGTGSGTFLDIAYVCRHHMRASTDLLSAYLLLPDVFVGRPGTENVEPNTYAAMKELDMLMDHMASDKESMSFGGDTICMSETPFDMVYLVNNRNRRGQVFNEVEELTELLGTGIFIASGAGGQDAGDVWDNLHDQLPTHASHGGKRPYYASFGVGEIVLDVTRFTREQQLRHAARAAEAVRTPAQATAHPAADQEEVIRREVDDFLSGLNLNSIDKLRGALDPAAVPYRLSIDGGGDAGEWQNALQGKAAHVNEQEARTRKRVEENFSAIHQTAKARVEARARAMVNGAGGVARSIEFFSHVARVLDQRHADAQKRLEGLAKGAPAVRDEFANRMKEFQAKQRYLGAVWRKGKVREAADNAAAIVDQETDIAENTVRYTSALTLVSGVRGEVREMVERLQRLSDRLAKVGEALRAQGAGAGPRQVRPFTIELPCPEHLKVEHPVDADSVLAYLAGREVDLLAHESRTDDELRDLFAGYASGVKGLADLGGFSIESFFTDRKVLHHHVALLDNLAEPMWQYETAYLHGGRGTHTIHIFGVPNSNQTCFHATEVSEALSGSNPSQLTSTNDPHRVFCYKVEAAIPGFALERMAHYRERYTDDEDVTYHIDRRWQESAPDLWPSKLQDRAHPCGASAQPKRTHRVAVPKISDVTVPPAGEDTASGPEAEFGYGHGADVPPAQQPPEEVDPGASADDADAPV